MEELNMALTTKQIHDLNHSMSSAKSVQLGTLLDGLIDDLLDSGEVTPSSSREVIVTDLTTVSYASVSLSGSPTALHFMSTATAGSVAGTVILQQWMPTSGSWVGNMTLSSGSTSQVFAPVSWIAVGV
jgi:hypothetical protein